MTETCCSAEHLLSSSLADEASQSSAQEAKAEAAGAGSKAEPPLLPPQVRLPPILVVPFTDKACPEALLWEQSLTIHRVEALIGAADDRIYGGVGWSCQIVLAADRLGMPCRPQSMRGALQWCWTWMGLC